MTRSNPVTSVFPFCLRHFSTARQVRVRDARLACTYAVLAALVLVYVVIFQLILEHRYAQFEVPVGYTNTWAGLSSPWPGGNTQAPAPEDMPVFCNNPQFDWGVNHTEAQRKLSGGLVAHNVGCLGFNPATDVEISGSSFTAVTSVGTIELDANDSVVASSQMFTANPEGAIPNLIHLYSVSFEGRGRQNVPTVIVNREGKVLREFADQAILTGISIGDWLEMAGVSLNSVNPQEEIGPPHPTFRLTGAVLMVRMVYTNLRRWELPYYRPLCTVTVEALPVAWGFMGSEVQPVVAADGTVKRASVQRTGVRLQFIQSGSIGRLDIFQIVLRLIEASVLFSIAAFATDFVAELPCCLGRRFARATTDDIATEDLASPGCFCRACPGRWADADQTGSRATASASCCGLCECGVPRAADGLPLDAKRAHARSQGAESPGVASGAAAAPDSAPLLAAPPAGAVVCCAFGPDPDPSASGFLALCRMRRRRSTSRGGAGRLPLPGGLAREAGEAPGSPDASKGGAAAAAVRRVHPK